MARVNPSLSANKKAGFAGFIHSIRVVPVQIISRLTVHTAALVNA